MIKRLAVAFVVVAFATEPAEGAHPVATFSIVGHDPKTGEIGVAVQSKFFAVGAVVPWARAEVGAIATQAFANTTFGPAGLELLAAGHSASAVVSDLLAGDPGRESRQLGVVDAEGRSAAHTGAACMAWAGHESGDGYTAQGNILTGADVVAAMGRAYRETGGMLGERLLRALEAGQEAGGDSRGMQSAAILIVKSGGGYGGFNDRYCDLRVDDHEQPIAELRRIFDLWKWNALIFEGYTLTESHAWDRAFEIAESIMRMAPENGESYYHPACFYSKAGRREKALALLSEAVRRAPDLGQRAAEDPDFEPLRSDPAFEALVARGP